MDIIYRSSRIGLLKNLEKNRKRQKKSFEPVAAGILLITARVIFKKLGFSYSQVEDKINRGGANLAVEIFRSDPHGNCDEGKGGIVFCDGIERSFSPGEIIILKPGQSITLLPGDWHAFWGHDGDVIVGEVSTVNDDVKDNIFRDEVSRFSFIDEDTTPIHLLVSDYPKWLSA